VAATQGTSSRPDGAIRLKRVYDPPAADDGIRLLVTRLWPRGVKKDAVDEWVKDLGTPRDMLSAYRRGELTYERFIPRYRAWLDAAPEAAAALERLAALVLDHDVTLLTSLGDLRRSHVPAVRQALAERALVRLGEAALRRTPRFEAVLFHGDGVTALAGRSEHGEDLLAMARGILASGRELVLGDAERGEARSPECYAGSYSVFGLPLVEAGRPVGALVAESGQLGRFGPGERDAVRELGRRAKRLLMAG
jgi:uncharacterized protein YeaO (DUF488 family)